MSLKHLLKTKVENLTGYYIHKKSDLPVGVDLKHDIQHKLKKVEVRTIFDVGANLGQTAIKFSNEFPNAKIHSFEPISSTYNKLVQNTKDYSNVICNNFALGNEVGETEISIFDEKDSGLNSLVGSNMNNKQDSKKEIIKISTIDEYLKANNIQNIDLLKIDTEGFEINVMNGAINAFKNNNVKLIFLEVGLDNKINKRHQYFVDIQSYLSEQNFVFVGFYEVIHSLLPIKFHFANALYINEKYL